MADDIIEQPQNYLERRNALLKEKNISYETVQRAWFTLSHMLLSEDAVVADIGCDEGALTYTMAVLYPQVKFIGIEKDKRKLNKAKISYVLPNLEFRHADASTQFDADASFDAIINSYVLHEIFSASRYNERIVSETLEAHFKMLKYNGLMFVQDYARPPPEEYVLLELPDISSRGKSVSDLSDADLLVWYSQHARPRHDSGTGGFFLDELPQRVPGTRLFRLPYKWAYEFIMRKHDRLHWEKELPIEYTFFTQADFRREIRRLGARASYTAPHWDEDYIEKHFSKKMRLLKDDGTQIGWPPTSFIAVARNMAERKSLLIHERRPSHTTESKLKISAMRDNTTGAITDIVNPPYEIAEVIPYRVDTATGRLKIYLHDGVPRAVANAVPRGGISIDDRRWSGHMIEPIAVKSEIIDVTEEYDTKKTILFARETLGMKPEENAVLTRGPEHFPAPDFIDDIIHTYYLEVTKTNGQITPKPSIIGAESFHEKGIIREVDAQQVLDAITVGKIPNARLELQILYLFNHLNIKAENWAQKQVIWKAGQIRQKSSLKAFMDNYGTESKRFKSIKGTAGQLRAVHSIFVEEGQTRGAVAGLAAKDMDFIVHNDKTINTAVVLPLSMGVKKDVHAGFILEHLPVPERHTGNASMISAPSFNLPAHITNIKLAREYLADQFGVLPEMVIKLGESYFAHIGMTQQKIYPFAVIVPPGKSKDPSTYFIPFYQMKLLKRSISRSPHMMIVLSRAYRYLHEDIRMDFARRVGPIVAERFEKAKPDWSLPLNFEPSPIRKPALDIIEATPEIKAPAPEIRVDMIKTEIRKPEAAQKAPEKEFEKEFEEFVEALEKQEPKPSLER